MAKKMKSKKRSGGNSAAKAAKPAKIARQKSLPGMADRKLASLERKALNYEEVKRERMALTDREVELKAEVLDEMHSLGRKHYRHGNIQVDIVPEGEKVKVKVLTEEAEVPTSELEGEAGLEETPELDEAEEKIEELRADTEHEEAVPGAEPEF